MATLLMYPSLRATTSSLLRRMRRAAGALALFVLCGLCLSKSAHARTPEAGQNGPKGDAHWTYRAAVGKVHLYHYTYHSTATTTADPRSHMEQSIEADVSVRVASRDREGQTTLEINTTNQKATLEKNGEWNPIVASLPASFTATMDVNGHMTSGRLLSNDSALIEARRQAGDDKIVERALKQIIFRQGARDTFYDGYTWTDTIPRAAPVAPGGRPAPPLQVQSITTYAVSAGTPSDPKVTWTLSVDGLTRGSTKGVPFTEATKASYVFGEADGMPAGYSSTVQTDRGTETYRTTRELKLRY